MFLRAIFAMLAALAMALAPIAMPGRATAAPPPAEGQHQPMAGHCDEQPGTERGSSDHKAVGHGCCIAMCSAVIASPASATGRLDRLAIRPGSDAFRRGHLGEIATPPPRPA